MAPHIKLIPLSMVICDTVIEDRKTGKKSLIGIFNRITSSKVPCIHPRLNIFISLTEGNGDYTVKLRCLKTATGQEIFAMEGPIRFQDPRQILEFNFELAGITFPDFGEYRFEFNCNNELLIARKFQVAAEKKTE